MLAPAATGARGRDGRPERSPGVSANPARARKRTPGWDLSIPTTHPIIANPALTALNRGNELRVQHVQTNSL